MAIIETTDRNSVAETSENAFFEDRSATCSPNAPERVPDTFGKYVADLTSQKAFSEASANEFRSFFSMIAKSANLDFYHPLSRF